MVMAVPMTAVLRVRLSQLLELLLDEHVAQRVDDEANVEGLSSHLGEESEVHERVWHAARRHEPRHVLLEVGQARDGSGRRGGKCFEMG